MRTVYVASSIAIIQTLNSSKPRHSKAAHWRCMQPTVFQLLSTKQGHTQRLPGLQICLPGPAAWGWAAVQAGWALRPPEAQSAGRACAACKAGAAFAGFRSQRPKKRYGSIGAPLQQRHPKTMCLDTVHSAQARYPQNAGQRWRPTHPLQSLAISLVCAMPALQVNPSSCRTASRRSATAAAAQASRRSPGRHSCCGRCHQSAAPTKPASAITCTCSANRQDGHGSRG